MRDLSGNQRGGAGTIIFVIAVILIVLFVLFYLYSQVKGFFAGFGFGGIIVAPFGLALVVRVAKENVAHKVRIVRMNLKKIALRRRQIERASLDQP